MSLKSKNKTNVLRTYNFAAFFYDALNYLYFLGNDSEPRSYLIKELSMGARAISFFDSTRLFAEKVIPEPEKVIPELT
jgi:hypothetical protein